MTKLPALIKAARGNVYHITDRRSNNNDGHITRCGRKINSLLEHCALNLEDHERCPHCGSMADFESISRDRILEEEAEKMERERRFRESKEIQAARNAARPALVDKIAGAITAAATQRGEVVLKMAPNADKLTIPVTWQGQQFIVIVDIWNGDR